MEVLGLVVIEGGDDEPKLANADAATRRDSLRRDAATEDDASTVRI